MTEVTCLCLRPEYLLGVQEQYLQWDCIPRGNTLAKAPFPPSKQQLSSFFSFFSFFPLSFLLATTSWGISIRKYVKEKRMSAFISWSTPLQKKKKKTGQSELLREKGYREAAALAICPGSLVLLGLETQSLQAAVSDSKVTLRVPPCPTFPWLRDMGHTRTL